MRRILLLFAILLPLLANAMKIEKNEIDEFTGQRTVITSWENFCQHEIHIRFRLQGDKTYLDFKFIPNAPIVIGDGADLLFKSTTDNIANFKSVGIFHGGKGEGSVGIIMASAWGITANYSGDLSWFTNNLTKLIRVYATDGYYDRKLSEKEGKKIQKLYELFTHSLSESIR